MCSVPVNRARRFSIGRGPGQSYRHSSTSREAEVAMGCAHTSENGWTLGSQGAGMELVSAALIDPQRGGRRHEARHREPLDTNGTKP
ncbi:jg15552 [Pararge aegeria aegeria]|uniref:Jg15552 protein n=1 Tax=Pararge aegeria aegeria TaxID=348720 RepID=A0A8S4RUR0_9NEOP|nr:jg15552 [Pararge aegeria aegeria]